METTESTTTLSGKMHLMLTTLVVMVGMGFLDGYLVELNFGTTRTGVFVMVILADICLLLVLRYVAVWIGKEVSTTKRGCSALEWILFMGAVVAKIFFIFSSVVHECQPAGLEMNGPSVELLKILDESNKYDSRKIETDDHNIHLDVRNIYEQGAVPGGTGLSTNGRCTYSFVARKLLTVLQMVMIGGLYLLLVGADHMVNITSFRELEELKMRTFWILIDIVDLLDLQSCVWESDQAQSIYSTACFIYFYCALVLMFLPPLSLLELCRHGEVVRPHRMLSYLAGSVVFVNVGSTVIRLVLIFKYRVKSISSVFIGKNIICLGMKVTKLVQLKLVDKGSLRFSACQQRDSQQERDEGPCSCDANGAALPIRDMQAHRDNTEEFSSTCGHAEHHTTSDTSIVTNALSKRESIANGGFEFGENLSRVNFCETRTSKRERYNSARSSTTSGSNAGTYMAAKGYNIKGLKTSSKRPCGEPITRSDCLQKNYDACSFGKGQRPYLTESAYSLAALDDLHFRPNVLQSEKQPSETSKVVSRSAQHHSSRSTDDILSLPSDSCLLSRLLAVQGSAGSDSTGKSGCPEINQSNDCSCEKRPSSSESCMSDFSIPPPPPTIPEHEPCFPRSNAIQECRQWERASVGSEAESTSV